MLAIIFASLIPMRSYSFQTDLVLINHYNIVYHILPQKTIKQHKKRGLCPPDCLTDACHIYQP